MKHSFCDITKGCCGKHFLKSGASKRGLKTCNWKKILINWTFHKIGCFFCDFFVNLWLCETFYRLKKGCPPEISGLRTTSLESQGAGQTRVGASKLPLAPLENLSREQSLMMAHKRQTFDLHISENALSAGNKFPRSSRGSIKDKISMWEGKEPSDSSDQSASIKKTQSFKTAEQKNVESFQKVSHKEKENFGRENGDSKSPADTGVQPKGTLRRPKSTDNHQTESTVDQKDVQNQEKEKENVEKLGDPRPCSPAGAVQQQQQVGTLRTSNDRKMTKQSGQDKKAVFTLFKRLEAMGDTYGRTPTELGNYFSPPCKDKQMEPKKKETDVVGRTSATAPSRVGPTDQENVYTQPGAPPINPVPKPQRTFRHPASPPVGITQRQGGGQRTLPPLPSSSTKACSKPPSGIHRRARGERVRENNANRYMGTASHTKLQSFQIILFIAQLITQRTGQISRKHYIFWRFSE